MKKVCRRLLTTPHATSLCALGLRVRGLNQQEEETRKPGSSCRKGLSRKFLLWLPLSLFSFAMGMLTGNRR